MTKAVTKAGIKKKVTVHTLRHSYATNLLDQGVPINYIKDLLGHVKIGTTLIYLHVTTRKLMEVESPIEAII